jgi:NADPH-dependent 2,4-dienoyl-CoA reductase/sulfur reductase-like enzyme
MVTGCQLHQGKPVLKVRDAQTQNDRDIVVDAVIAGIGIQPNVELAQSAGLEVDNGIRVDGGLRTSQPEIYSAGDAANFYNSALDQRLRVEHEDNANAMGRMAGQAMAGRPVSYDNYLPSSYSDLSELGFEAVGAVDARLNTVVDWKVPFQEGMTYYLYLLNDRVRGALLWNVREQVDANFAQITRRDDSQVDGAPIALGSDKHVYLLGLQCSRFYFEFSALATLLHSVKSLSRYTDCRIARWPNGCRAIHHSPINTTPS